MVLHQGLEATLCMFIFLTSSQGTRHSFTDVANSVEMSGLHQTTEIMSLMDLLDSQYTPQCLRVVISMQRYNESISPLFSSVTAKEYDEPFINYGETHQGAFVNGESKPTIHLISYKRNAYEVEKVIHHINTNPRRLNSIACVSYLLSGPPDSSLLTILTEPFSGKRITRYFLVHTQNSTEAEQFLLDQRLGRDENVAALVQEESQNKRYWRVLIRQLLHPSGSPQVLTVNRWSRDTGLTSTENIFPEQMANFYGQKLTGITIQYLPFADLQTTEGSLVVKYKPCVDKFIVETLAQQLNFTYEMVVPADGQWGHVENGKYVGMVGEIESGRANFVLDLTVTLARAQHVYFSHYYFIDVISFITPKSSADPLWRKLITPFRGTVWLCVLFSVGGGMLVYYFIYTIQTTLASSPVPSSSAAMNILASFLSQSLKHGLWLQGGRVFFGFWLLYSFLVTSYYTTFLTSTLAVPFPPFTINTVQELLQSGLSYGMDISKGASYDFLEASTNPDLQTVFRGMALLSTEENLRLADEGKHAYIYWRGNLDLLLAVHNSNPKRTHDLHMAAEGHFPSGYACAAPPGSPYIRTFNAVLQGCIEAGLISKWMKDSLSFFVEKPQPNSLNAEANNNRDKADSGQIVLTLNHLQGPFFIWFMGCSGGLLLLLLESVFWRMGY